MKKMRKFVTLLFAIIILSLSVAVPVCAETTVAEWHTDQFKETYAKIKKTEAWGNLDYEVQKQIYNYARSDREEAEAVLILRTIDMEVYSKNQEKKEESTIGKMLDLMCSKEFQTYILLKELAKLDRIEAKKNAKGIYQIYEVSSSK